jgi:hypothetical protein
MESCLLLGTPFLASASLKAGAIFLMSGYPYVRIRPPRVARSFENADIFPPAESGTEQTNIILQL